MENDLILIINYRVQWQGSRYYFEITLPWLKFPLTRNAITYTLYTALRSICSIYVDVGMYQNKNFLYFHCRPIQSIYFSLGANFSNLQLIIINAPKLQICIERGSNYWFFYCVKQSIDSEVSDIKQWISIVLPWADAMYKQWGREIFMKIALCKQWSWKKNDSVIAMNRDAPQVNKYWYLTIDHLKEVLKPSVYKQATVYIQLSVVNYWYYNSKVPPGNLEVD